MGGPISTGTGAEYTFITVTKFQRTAEIDKKIRRHAMLHRRKQRVSVASRRPPPARVELLLNDEFDRGIGRISLKTRTTESQKLSFSTREYIEPALNQPGPESEDADVLQELKALGHQPGRFPCVEPDRQCRQQSSESASFFYLSPAIDQSLTTISGPFNFINQAFQIIGADQYLDSSETMPSSSRSRLRFNAYFHRLASNKETMHESTIWLLRDWSAVLYADKALLFALLGLLAAQVFVLRSRPERRFGQLDSKTQSEGRVEYRDSLVLRMQAAKVIRNQLGDAGSEPRHSIAAMSILALTEALFCENSDAATIHLSAVFKSINACRGGHEISYVARNAAWVAHLTTAALTLTAPLHVFDLNISLCDIAQAIIVTHTENLPIALVPSKVASILSRQSLSAMRELGRYKALRKALSEQGDSACLPDTPLKLLLLMEYGFKVQHDLISSIAALNDSSSVDKCVQIATLICYTSASSCPFVFPPQTALDQVLARHLAQSLQAQGVRRQLTSVPDLHTWLLFVGVVAVEGTESELWFVRQIKDLVVLLGLGDVNRLRQLLMQFPYVEDVCGKAEERIYRKAMAQIRW